MISSIKEGADELRFLVVSKKLGSVVDTMNWGAVGSLGSTEPTLSLETLRRVVYHAAVYRACCFRLGDQRQSIDLP